MNKSKQPGINFENIILKDMHFERKPNFIEKPEIDVQFTAASATNEEKTFMNLEITTKLTDKKESFALDFTLVGSFSIMQNDANMPLEQFAQTNAPALMIPYIRETISNITMRSGLKPVIIPPINVASMVQVNVVKITTP